MTLLIIDNGGNPLNYTGTPTEIAAVIATAFSNPATPPIRVEAKNS